MDRWLRAIRIIHPFPSALTAGLTGGLAIIAGGSGGGAILLAVAMLGFQASIGALNDLADLASDTIAKPWKPIPARAVTPTAALAVVVAGAVAGITLSASFGVAAMAVGIAGYGCGVGYDLVLKRRSAGWLAFSLAFPLLVSYPWIAVIGELPPRATAILPIALVAGPALHLANSMVDLDADMATGAGSLAVRLGRERSLVALACLIIGIHVAAWGTLVGGGSPPDVAVVTSAAASMLAIGGLLGSAASRQTWKALGWTFQAISLAILGLAWLTAAASQANI